MKDKDKDKPVKKPKVDKPATSDHNKWGSRFATLWQLLFGAPKGDDNKFDDSKNLKK